MTGVIFDDVRRMLLGLLFVLAFGWMAAQVLPGSDAEGNQGWQQLALAGHVVPPQP